MPTQSLTLLPLAPPMPQRKVTFVVVVVALHNRAITEQQQKIFAHTPHMAGEISDNQLKGEAQSLLSTSRLFVDRQV